MRFLGECQPPVFYSDSQAFGFLDATLLRPEDEASVRSQSVWGWRVLVRQMVFGVEQLQEYSEELRVEGFPEGEGRKERPA
jgi:hypothetical protein